MTIVRVKILADSTIQDPPFEGVTPPARVYAKDERYDVSLNDAQILARRGHALALEVPPQEGLPLGCQDAAQILAATQALFPQPAPVVEPPKPLPPEPTPT